MSFCEIEVFREEKGRIYGIYEIYRPYEILCSRDRQKIDKRGSMTKKSHQKFSTVKWKSFPKQGHSKIWSTTFLSVPQSRRQVPAHDCITCLNRPTGRDLHPLKPIMHIQYYPYFHKIYKSALFPPNL